jgi:N-acylglucosamine 2-epimerase
MEKSYSRRNFLKQNSVAGLGILTAGSLPGCRGEKGSPGDDREADTRIGKIAGMNLEQLLNKYRTELNNFILSMDNHAIDHEHGGVMCSLDVRSGELANTNKTAWFTGRGLWLYSFLYNNIEKNDRSLEIAQKSKDLLLKLRPGDDSFWPHTFSREGVPLTGPGDIYGSLFVAEGLSEYAKATGEMNYRELAKRILFDCVSRYDRSDYVYNIVYLPDPPQIKGTRVLGHWMIFLSMCTQMLKNGPDDDLERLAARSVDAIMNYHVNPAHGLSIEFINHDLSIPDNEIAQLSIIGHGLETFAFIMFEAARREDTDLFLKAQAMFKKHVEVARDALYGGYFHTLRHVDNFIWDTRKSLWCQQEVLNGALFLIEHTGDEWAHRHFARTDAYIHRLFFNSSNKFWYSSGDRQMANPSTGLLEHYHHCRQLMLGILSIERMIGRNGKTSGLFA